jgi:hypothetical protein
MSPTSQTDEQRIQHWEAAAVAMKAFQPSDEIESMIAAQALAMHHASMECSRRAMIPGQLDELAHGFRKAAANSSRTADGARPQARQRGPAAVTVEHVHVHAGGQAVVGTIATTTGGGVAEKTAREPRVAPPGLAHDASLGTGLSPVRGEGPAHALLFAARVVNGDELNLHRDRPRDRSVSYFEAMNEIPIVVERFLRAAQEAGRPYRMIIHGSSASGPGKTTARSQVRDFMRSKLASPLIERRYCIQHETVFIQHETVFVAKIRLALN